MLLLRKLAPLRAGSPAFRQSRCYGTGVIKCSEEVRQAKANRQPLVALESTIITHGMPYPQNLETAVQVEEIIRNRGAVPATIAILGGELHVGLTTDQLQYLAQAKGVVKASRRDMAPVMASGLDGATTVAGTIIAAELADIPVFVTGGIGGVHREGEQTLDISADLTEVGRSRTLIVCSGVKSILDIGRTLEYLETQGVCVCSFGDSEEFPAFYTARSGHRAPHRAADAKQAAKIAFASRKLELASGIVVAVPLPKEFAMDEAVIDSAIEHALKEAKVKGIRGKEVTPFILAAVAEATGGASLAANIALIKNNAKVGADIAVELNKLRNVENLNDLSNIRVSRDFGNGSPKSTRGIHTSSRHRSEALSKKRNDSALLPLGRNTDGPVVVIGGANVDRTYRLKEGQIQFDGSTHVCASDTCAGGVGRNMAEALWRMRGPNSVRLITAIGDDADGQYLADIAPRMLVNGCVKTGVRTPTYAALLDSKGECLLGLGDMTLHSQISIDLIEKHVDLLKQSPLLVLDGNAPQETIDYVLQLCKQMDKPVFFEPTDRRKAVKTLRNKYQVKFASPNLEELRAMANFIQSTETKHYSDPIDEIMQLSQIVSKLVDTLLITVGARGVIVVRNNKIDGCLRARLYPVLGSDDVVNVSGAGDCFSSGFINAMLSGLNEEQCIVVALQAATDALKNKNTVPYTFSIPQITNRIIYDTLL